MKLALKILTLIYFLAHFNVGAQDISATELIDKTWIIDTDNRRYFTWGLEANNVLIAYNDSINKIHSGTWKLSKDTLIIDLNDSSYYAESRVFQYSFFIKRNQNEYSLEIIDKGKHRPFRPVMFRMRPYE